ncbi:ATP-binding protein [Streptomyces virginiae]|uniref:ATP-binding protein n=1 Tax=Streptomyces virginiae TaxID=1961 RepID=UPI00369BBF8B
MLLRTGRHAVWRNICCRGCRGRELGQVLPMGPPSSGPGLPAGMNCGQARERARCVLAGYGAPAALVADVLTVVSELVANAIRHAGGVTGFDIRRRGGLVVIEVSDCSQRLPHPRPPSPGGPDHFGWRLVKPSPPASSSAFASAGRPSPPPLPPAPRTFDYCRSPAGMGRAGWVKRLVVDSPRAPGAATNGVRQEGWQPVLCVPG